VRQEELSLRCPSLGRCLRVALRGEGVSPSLTVEPADGILDLGHCLEVVKFALTFFLISISINLFF